MRRLLHALSVLLLFGPAGAESARAGDGGAARLRPLISLRHPGVDWLETEKLAEWMGVGEGEGEGKREGEGRGREAREGRRADATRDEPAPLVVLDAREPDEYEVSHLLGAHRVDPDAGDVKGELPDGTPQDARIVVYCSVGYRSAAVARRLEKAGYEHVFNLEGGIFQWANEGRPVYRDGEPVERVHPYDATWGRLLDARLHSPD